MGMIESRLNAVSHFPHGYKDIVFKPEDAFIRLEQLRDLRMSKQLYIVSTYDASNASPLEVREWLDGLRISGVVDITWIGINESIRLDFSVFATFYDDLWFPGSDDVWITSSSMNWLLEFSHEEVFSLYSFERN